MYAEVNLAGHLKQYQTYLKAEDQDLSKFSPTMLTPGTLRNKHPMINIPVIQIKYLQHNYILTKNIKIITA